MSSRPNVMVYAQVSVDGKITSAPNASSKGFGDLEGPRIQAYRHAQRARVDAIMVGSRTVWSDNPSLTVRFASGANPLRVIPAGSGHLPPDAAILNDGNPTLVVVGKHADPEQVRALKTRESVEVVCCGEERVDFAALLEDLGARGIHEMMVEGGGTLIAHMLSCDLIDELYIQHVPVVLGGTNVPTLVSGFGVEDIAHGRPARLVDASDIDGHLVVRYSLRDDVKRP
jgi:5-amino-6-(5-phosphoribosylamino)uracil reductase